MDFFFKIREPCIQNAPLPFDMCVTWAWYTRLNISWNMLGKQNAFREQSSNQQLYRFVIERISLLNNSYSKSAFVVNQEGLFHVPVSLLRDSFGIKKSFEGRFVDVLARWLFTRETSGAGPAFIDALQLWKARVPTYNNHTVDKTHRYEHVLPSPWSLLLVPKKCKPWCESK